MKAILIARVSTEEQREAGNSLPAQVARLERYCHNKGMTILQTCSFDESAYTNNRSEFDRIIDIILAQQEKIAVCCDKVDRLSRNVFDKRISILYNKALQDEIELHFVSDGQIITSRISAVEKFQFSMSLGLAKYYSDAISDNVRRAQEQMLRNGVWLSKAPYGYKNITNTQGNADIIVVDYESNVIKKTFELYATGVHSIDTLLKEVKSQHTVTWPRGQLAKILNNPFYYGMMRCKEKLYPHKYPSLISKELFDTVQNLKNASGKKPFKHVGKNLFLYRGLMRCGECGLIITPEIHGKYKYYHCTQYKGKHGAVWFREEDLTEVFRSVFKSIQLPQEAIEQISAALNTLHEDKVAFHTKEFDKLTTEQKGLTKMMDNLYIDKLKGSITDTDYDRFFQRFREQIADVNLRLEKLQDAEDNYYMTSRSVLALVSQAYDLFESSEVEQRRLLIKLVLSNLRIEGEKVLYDVQEPFNLIAKTADCILWRS